MAMGFSCEQQRWPWDELQCLTIRACPGRCKHLWPTSFAQLGRPAGYTLHVNLHVNLDVRPRMAVWHLGTAAARDSCHPNTQHLGLHKAFTLPCAFARAGL